MKTFDWHSDPVKESTPITPSYRHTQNVRRFFKSKCGPNFKLDRSFMSWITSNVGKTMGDAVKEWRRRQRGPDCNAK